MGLGFGAVKTTEYEGANTGSRTSPLEAAVVALTEAALFAECLGWCLVRAMAGTFAVLRADICGCHGLLPAFQYFWQTAGHLLLS